jgi:hypothetical protein
MSFRIAAPTGAPAVPRSSLPSSPASGTGAFGDLVARHRSSQPASASAAALPMAPAAPHPSVLGDVGRQLLARVARGERSVEAMVHQGLSGRAFTPADLLAMQAQVYRYAQELELVSKLVDRATSTVKTVLQQNG